LVSVTKKEIIPFEMKKITLTVSNVSRLNHLQSRLADNESISLEDKLYLSEFLSQLPSTNKLLAEKTPLEESLSVSLWDTLQIEAELEKWRQLFEKIPGWDYCPCCCVVDNDNLELLQQNVVMFAWFAPSYVYNSTRTTHDPAYEIWLKGDGTASFELPTLQDAEQYPELYNFKGSWKEAYYLLIETLKNGWPMEEFPEELQQFLKK
jgi:hypothetical protein